MGSNPACPTKPNVSRLDRLLRSSPSATALLERLWAERWGDTAASLRAQLVAGPPPPEPPDLRTLLEVADAEALGHRRVALGVGTTMLSEAENWFVPARLTATMRALLVATDTPFGRVIASLAPSRTTLATEQPPAGGRVVLRHRALVVAQDGRPLALVAEDYLAAALALG